MAKKEHKHDNFIPSPFGVVTSYENAFIKEFNNNLSGAVAEVLQYIAKATASDIKESKEVRKSFEDELEKAHNVGDIHPNHPDWVWTEYAPGKFDWRSNKKRKKSGSVNPWDSVPSIEKAKNVTECLKVLEDAGAIKPSSDVGLFVCKLETVKKVCNVIYNIHNIFHMDKISLSAVPLKGATAQARGGNAIELNLNYYKDFDSGRYYKTCTEDYVKNLSDNLNSLLKKEKGLKESGNYDPQLGKGLTTKIDLIKYKLNRFPCWTTGEKETCCEDVVIHELGHILNSQCTGSCGVMPYWIAKKKRSDEYIKLSEELNNECKDLFYKYIKENKQAVSEYSTTKRAEFFAECFVAYVHKSPRLPKYMKEYLDKYFKSTTPKNLM